MYSMEELRRRAARNDLMPDVPKAGILSSLPGEPASISIFPDLNVDRFRRDDPSLTVSSQKNLHINRGRRFGSNPVKENKDVNLITRPPLSELKEWFELRKESIYRTSRREPLGKPYQRGFIFPEFTKLSDFRFGVSTTNDEAELVGTTIFPPSHEKTMLRKSDPEALAEDPRIKQKIDLHYDWRSTHVDPETFRFGKTEAKGVESTQNCLTMAEPLLIQSSKLINMRESTKCPVGRARALPHNLRQLPPDHRYGIVAPSDQTWGAAECFIDLESTHELLDVGLGRMNRRDQLSSRYVPDIVHGMKSSSGDSAHDAIHPPRLGDEFTLVRSPDEIREIWEQSGLQITDETFSQTIEAARYGN